MKIGIFSDLHNRTDHLEPAMHRMRLLGCGHFIFLGDCTTPESFRRLIELTEDFPLDAVPGNNDYDVETMRRMAASSPAARLHPEHALITRYGMKLSLSHYPKYALREARSGNADAALYGRRMKKQSGKFPVLRGAFYCLAGPSMIALWLMFQPPPRAVYRETSVLACW